MRSDIQKIVPHVLYEWRMLCSTYDLILSSEAQGDVTSAERRVFVGTMQFDLNPLGAAVLESFLLHARVIRDFLWKDREKKKRKERDEKEQDDVLASDFFENDRDWKNARPEKGQLLRAEHTRLNKALAHLTYPRDVDTRDWDLSSIKRELDEGWEAFLKALPPEKRSWFSS